MMTQSHLTQLFSMLKGGARSGHRGHAGRIGKRGGSAPGPIRSLAELNDRLRESYQVPIDDKLYTKGFSVNPKSIQEHTQHLEDKSDKWSNMKVDGSRYAGLFDPVTNSIILPNNNHSRHTEVADDVVGYKFGDKKASDMSQILQDRSVHFLIYFGAKGKVNNVTFDTSYAGQANIRDSEVKAIDNIYKAMKKLSKIGVESKVAISGQDLIETEI